MTASGEPPSFEAVILAGGRARRLGGIDKALVEVAGVSLLERSLEAAASARRIVVAGPPRSASRAVVWTREEPVGGGPVAAIAAAMPYLSSGTVVVLAVDHPFISPEVVNRLVTVVGAVDGALLVDDDGRDQPLIGAYRRAVLTEALGRIPNAAGASVRALLSGMDLHRINDARAAIDVDTFPDLERARALAARLGRTEGEAAHE
jgi:molybdopterin-guanine dinucleotide biosynthesis protein A